MTTSRVGPTASRAWPDRARLRAVTDDPSSAMTTRSSTQASDSGTRCGPPSGEAVATQTSIAGVASIVRVSALRVGSSRASAATSVELPDADEVAGGVAEGAVAHSVRLVGRFLDDLGVAGLHLLEGAVEVLGGEQDPAERALRHHLGDGAALVVGDARIDGGRCEEQVRVGLVGRPDGDPAHLALTDVETDLEAEDVAVERHGRVGVVVREGARVNGDVHDAHAKWSSTSGASRFLTGLVTCLTTQGGTPAAERVASRR